MKSEDARTLFVAGTDTGVGKSVVSSWLLRSARAQGLRVAAMKPVASGAVRTRRGWRNDDALQLIEAMGGDVEDPALYARVNPYCFEPPISPHLAAREAGVRIDLAHLNTLARQWASRHDLLVIEGAGGWLAPLDDEHQSMADLAVTFGAPVLLVVGLRLGCLNHAALTLRAIRASGLPFAGWIGNAIDPHFERVEENVDTLTRRLGTPPLALHPHEPDPAARTRLPPLPNDRWVDIAGRSNGSP